MKYDEYMKLAVERFKNKDRCDVNADTHCIGVNCFTDMICHECMIEYKHRKGLNDT